MASIIPNRYVFPLLIFKIRPPSTPLTLLFGSGIYNKPINIDLPKKPSAMPVCPLFSPITAF